MCLSALPNEPHPPMCLSALWFGGVPPSLSPPFLSAQGDREVDLSLPVSPFMDRTKSPLATTVVNCQIGFINVLVRPLLSEWAVFLGPEADRDIVITLEATLRYGRPPK